MDLTTHREDLVPGEDRSWLAQRKGMDTCRPITLDLALFDDATHYPDGFIPSGTVIARVTATQRWGPFDPLASDGREEPGKDDIGLLFNTQIVKPGNETGRAGAPLFWEGNVRENRLPANSGIDAAAKAAMTTIRFDA